MTRYCGFTEWSSEPLRRREIAQDSVTVIFNLGPQLLVGGREEPLSARQSFAAASLGEYGVTEFTGPSRGIEVKMTPLGARALFGQPMDELSPVVVPLEQALAGSGLLTEQLACAPGWQARFDLLDAELAGRLRERPAPPPDVAWAWGRLTRSSGRLSIGSLLEELGCSRRHLSARFREQIGITPKTAARLLRFRRCVELLGEDGTRFAEIAAACGYYDQPHMNRDFREFSGTTPRSFLASALPDGLGVAAEPEVTSIQDLPLAAA